MLEEQALGPYHPDLHPHSGYLGACNSRLPLNPLSSINTWLSRNNYDLRPGPSGIYTPNLNFITLEGEIVERNDSPELQIEGVFSSDFELSGRDTSMASLWLVCFLLMDNEKHVINCVSFC
ncbi:PREDICTED: uncharacterized protein LOC105591032 [Cercocebus atys]|uniref:uncharacterized protein LOC105591032 n=1 Tax=Cercocebus atys TaxID=9531 RepID=UPI0005F3ACA9|nr:PREDICTED: uncharacterized protein LOC105591032 [Cercocebus atys]